MDNPTTDLSNFLAQVVTGDEQGARSWDYFTKKLDDFLLLKPEPPLFPKLLEALGGHFSAETLSPAKQELAEKILRFLWRGENTGDVRPGTYKHFKGNLYTVEKIALLLKGQSEEPAVIYFANNDPSKVFVRPLCEWYDIVLWPDGEYRLRFMRV